MRREGLVGELVPCGMDPRPHLEAIRAYADAGFEEVGVVQCGDDKEAFFRFRCDRLRPELS